MIKQKENYNNGELTTLHGQGLQKRVSAANHLVTAGFRGHEVDFDLKKVFDMPNIEVSGTRNGLTCILALTANDLLLR